MAKLNLLLKKVIKIDDQKFNLILDKLLEKTEQGKLQWERTAAKNTFLIVLEDGSISISHTISDKHSFEEMLNGGIYTLNIRDQTGHIAESVEISKSNKNSVAVEKTSKVFQLAKHQVNETVDRILEQLAA